jgi:hypothetical protein
MVRTPAYCRTARPLGDIDIVTWFCANVRLHQVWMFVRKEVHQVRGSRPLTVRWMPLEVWARKN